MPSDSKNNLNLHDVGFNTFRESLLSLASGFGCGLVVAFTFNPWDKGLYLSVIHERPFLDIRNFNRPFQGATQSLAQRSISHGIYFPLEHFGHSIATNALHLGPNAASIAAGTFAGAVNAFILNPIAAIKYTSWNDRSGKSYFNQLVSMYSKGGSQQFLKGIYATMARDVVFGSIFAYLRHSRRRKYKEANHDAASIPFATKLYFDASAGFVATFCSSPFNFVRNMQYEKNEKMIPSMITILRQLRRDGMAKGSNVEALKFWLFRLRIGWGTARVAVGMSFTSFCYEMTQKYIHQV